jgi:nitrite reductase/ring-hydroxylating ferredoxin subunit
MVPIRIARVDEIPPGSGKVVELPHCTVTVYNVEGRYFADVEHTAHLGAQVAYASPPPPVTAPCRVRGRRFSATVEDSPARVASHARELAPAVEGDYVVLLLANNP